MEPLGSPLARALPPGGANWPAPTGGWRVGTSADGCGCAPRHTCREAKRARGSRGGHSADRSRTFEARRRHASDSSDGSARTSPWPLGSSRGMGNGPSMPVGGAGAGQNGSTGDNGRTDDRSRPRRDKEPLAGQGPSKPVGGAGAGQSGPTGKRGRTDDGSRPRRDNTPPAGKAGPTGKRERTDDGSRPRRDNTPAAGQEMPAVGRSDSQDGPAARGRKNEATVLTAKGHHVHGSPSTMVSCHWARRRARMCSTLSTRSISSQIIWLPATGSSRFT